MDITTFEGFLMVFFAVIIANLFTGVIANLSRVVSRQGRELRKMGSIQDS